MATRVFTTVWYLPRENRWGVLHVLAYGDAGKLTVGESAIEFIGRKQTVVITNILGVSYGKQGRDFVNKWVKIEYDDGSSPAVAFFADGSLRGWGGIFGGTKRILNTVQEHIAGKNNTAL